jgi:hypothetical protein
VSLAPTPMRTHPSQLRDRLVSLITALVPEKGRFRTLAAKSQLTEDAWRGMWYDRQRASVFMIEFAAREWPQHAFWLVTGVTDQRAGHSAPAGVDPFPEQLLTERTRAVDVFKQAIKVRDLATAGADVPLVEKALLDQLIDARLQEQAQLDKSNDERLAVAAAFDEIATRPLNSAKDKPSALLKLLERLQLERGWPDAKMAEELGLSVDQYKASRYEGVPLATWASRARLLDRWGYDRVRDAILSIMPGEQESRRK